MLSGVILGLAAILSSGLEPADQSTAAAIPSGIVGIPYAYNIGDGVSQIEFFPGAVVTYSYTLTGGNLPPGLTLESTGLVTGVPQLDGDFVFDTLFAFSTSLDGQTVDLNLPNTYSISISGTSGSKVIAQPGGLIFALSTGGSALTQAVIISNRSAQSVAYSISNVNGSEWLSVNPSGTVDPFATTSVPVTASPTTLSTGTYTGALVTNISTTGESFTTTVIATVSGDAPAITLSNTGLRFESVTGGGIPLPQSIAIIDSGAQPLSYSVSASPLTPGQNWLVVPPSTGNLAPSALSSVQVEVTPGDLVPGTYYGQVLFAATDPGFQASATATVVLNVYTPQESPGAETIPTGLIFIGQASGPDPAAQTVFVKNPSISALTFLAAPPNWLNVQPSSGTANPGNNPLNLSVQPSLQGLAAGVFAGDLVLRFEEDNSARHVQVLLIVTPTGSSMASSVVSSRDMPGCTPATLQMVFNQIPQGYQAVVGYPQVLGVGITDNCGNPMTTGTVTATFSNGDPQQELVSLQDGNWTVTWTPYNAAANMTITVDAKQSQPALETIGTIGGTATANPTSPTVKGGGIVSAANFATNQPLAPGSFAAIFGSNLSQGLNASTTLPLGLQLGGTSVVLAGGEQLPLLFASSGQVNVVVPYDVQVNTTHLLVVQQGSAISNTQSVVIAPAQPAVFTQNGVGTGAAITNVYKADGTELPNNSPVTSGDVIVLYCSGLGMVDPPVAAGSPAPASRLSHTVSPVTVTIGQTQAQVLFAGLTPLYAQLYQVNVQIPSGLPSGDAVLTVSAGGQQSVPVTITVQ